jgi:hypothetical protein
MVMLAHTLAIRKQVGVTNVYTRTVRNSVYLLVQMVGCYVFVALQFDILALFKIAWSKYVVERCC